MLLASKSNANSANQMSGYIREHPPVAKESKIVFQSSALHIAFCDQPDGIKIKHRGKK
jgi:hypothetical protein